MNSIQQLTQGSPYQSYLYSYPHKTSYRTFTEPVSLQSAWGNEDTSNLFLYLHVPFCEMRCGFCNLFTTAKPKGAQEGDLVKNYLDAVEMQARAFRDAVPKAQFSRLAIGGGTPTYLAPSDLQRLFSIATDTFGMDLQRTPISVESSPETASLQRLAVLRQNHVNRISIGVQSFVDAEVRSVGRAQKRDQVLATLGDIRSTGFDILNIDLMYGLPGQTSQSWLESLEQALVFSPEEIYLYPLYVRPLTGVSKLGRSWDDERIALYRQGRDFLNSRGYEQVSMRMFRQRNSNATPAPVYCCQADGMVGLGPGARSYTQSLHYSSEYAVRASGVREILSEYNTRGIEQMSHIAYGTRLNSEEQQRRHVLLSLLHVDGLHLQDYSDRFGSDAKRDLPELSALLQANLATEEAGVLSLTDTGVERADAIGPFLHSQDVNAKMREFELR